MARALELAARGYGHTSPNPMVGAVVVKNGRVVAEGYHRRAGSDHAEIVALKKAQKNGRKTVGATVYVNLEPCCHVGRTGPCTLALIKAGVKRVVYATTDPNPMVNGKGARSLRQSGLEVKGGVLRKEARRLNEVYFGVYRTGRPFVTLKMAQSLDGRIATVTGDSQWISGPPALKVVHQLRAGNDAILIGRGTLKADNPALTVRNVKGKNPYRIVVTESGRLPGSCQFLDNNDDQRSIVAISAEGVKRLAKRTRGKNLTYWTIKSSPTGGLDLADLLVRAGEFGLCSVLIEGGSGLATSFLKAQLVDKVVMVVAPIIIGRGTDTIGDLGIRKLSRNVGLDDVDIQQVGRDIVVRGYPNYRR
ncbi:MAG: bifunctional diaminohydroxyphosphoribosylaminopyrimidine deaminase/5-amino-6-(5-phosphoribosylamino)uracil reductase RibD [candidate division Zixibacteria bacterium]|nr:bifunctional diaminohydroxyphosphoribosylaminopyrimidine deaminase/5-amino-6-(5-phosphoribosylamino)uracil reductase RibD [candidate division Zixibacteria bacterium]